MASSDGATPANPASSTPSPPRAWPIVSDIKGTTTDPGDKGHELLPLGPVVLIDTPGLDDTGELGELRVRKAYQMLNKTDIAVLVVRRPCRADGGGPSDTLPDTGEAYPLPDRREQGGPPPGDGRSFCRPSKTTIDIRIGRSPRQEPLSLRCLSAQRQARGYRS